MSLTEFINPTSFIGQALWTLLFLSLLTAPMGCFVVWRKLSYFGATLAHSALLGAILGLLTGVGILFGVIGFTALLAIILSFWLQHRLLSSDTILGFIAHLSLAISVIAVSVMDDLRIDLVAYLFGDVLSISTNMFYTTIAISLFSLLLIALNWRGLINLAVQTDIARIEGYPTQRLELMFMLILSMTIALGMLSIGVLLIIAMLIIPAATARLFSRSLIQMAWLTWGLTIISIVNGLALSYLLDFPAGPTVVVVAGMLFIIANGIQLIRSAMGMQ